MLLALSPLAELCDPDQENLFLGNVGIPLAFRQGNPGLKYLVTPCLWDSPRRVDQAVAYTGRVYRRLLPLLADYLNQVHGTDHAPRYWRIIIGSWLIHHIHWMYDKYLHIIAAYEEHPGLQCRVMPPDLYYTCRDYHEANQLVADDSFNLQLMSCVVSALDLARQEVPTAPPAPMPANKGGGKVEWISRLAALGSKLIPGRRRAALMHLNFGAAALAAMALRSGFKTAPCSLGQAIACPPARLDQARKGLELIPAEDEFQRVLVSSMSACFPRWHLEGYKKLREYVRKRAPRVPRVLATTHGLHSHEGFKLLAAEKTNEGGLLLACQHGGGYGMAKNFCAEDLESEAADRFYAWGWAPDDNRRWGNLPSPKLSRLLSASERPAGDGQAGQDIYLVSNMGPRYLYRLASFPMGSQWRGQMQGIARFHDALPAGLAPKLKVRTYVHDFGWGVREELNHSLGQGRKMRFDEGTPIVQPLLNSRLVVVDHLMTTFLEVLLLGVPTLFYWDEARWPVRPGVEGCLDRLREAGVLWHTPEQAAAKARQVYEHAGQWWQEDEIQEARRVIVEKFCLASSDYIGAWLRALKTVAAEEVGGDALASVKGD